MKNKDIPQTKIKKKKFTVNTKNMGINIDKNEYYEIKQSQSNYPQDYL